MSASPGSVRARLFKGLGAQAASQMTRSLVQIVNVPLLIHFWGVGLYGEWLILSAVPAYFAMSDMGFGDVAGNEMTMRAAEDDHASAVEVLQSVWVLTTALCAVAVAIGVAGAWLGSLSDWLNLTRMDDRQAARVLTLGLAAVLVGQQNVLVAGVLRAQKLFAEATFLSNLLYVFEVVAFAGTVAVGGGPVSAALVTLLVRTGAMLVMWRYAMRVTPWLALGVRRARFATVRRLFRPAVAFLAFPLGNALSIQGMVLVVGRILGPAAVVGFSTVRTMTNAAKQAMGIIRASIWPEVSIAFGRGDRRVARELHRRACQSALMLTLAASLVLLVGGQAIVRVWTNGEVAVEPAFLRWMLAATLANCLWFTSSVLPSAINRHVRLATLFMITTGLSLLAAAWLLPRVGLTAVPAALFFADVAMVAYVIPTSLRLVHDGFSEFVGSLFDLPRLWRELRLRRAS